MGVVIKTVSLRSEIAPLLIFLIIAFIATVPLSALDAYAKDMKALEDAFMRQTDGRGSVSYHERTGRARFISTGFGETGTRPDGIIGGAGPQSAARKFLEIYAPLFGISDPASDLAERRVTRNEGGHSFVRYQQVSGGVPVLGGEIVVHLDHSGNVRTILGKASPFPRVDNTPGVAAETAVDKAVAVVAKHHKISRAGLEASTPELWIYNPVLLGLKQDRTSLVWRVEVTAAGGLIPVRELVLVDAVKGHIALHFNQIDFARDRLVYDNNNDPGLDLPGISLVRIEGGAATGVADVDNAYTFSGDTYDFYFTYHGRDSIDNAGMSLVNTVRYCDPADDCPYQNAFWNGDQMVFGEGFASADDVVGHELTHGVTEHESGLFYFMQSGAINESFSDVWGELIDQVNGLGDDSVPVKWLVGEDLPIGAIRSMQDPTIYSDPDRMTSANYNCDRNLYDQGGVHSNSGINNKAAYLMVAGGSFNGKSVVGIGITKAAKIYYEVQANLLTSGSDYADLYYALQTACANLAGTSGITLSDCQQVKNAIDAVEMNLQPVSCGSPEVPYCPAGQTVSVLFSDGFETDFESWTNIELRKHSKYAIWEPADFYASVGVKSAWGWDADEISDAYIAKTSSIPLPAGAYLRFDHSYEFEHDISANYDGGVVEYSTDGGSVWSDLRTYFTENGYTGVIDNSYGNPLGGRNAFAGTSSGYITSRANLSSFAGQDFRFRYRVASDMSVNALGWFVDNVLVYSCGPVPVTVTTSPPGRQISVDGSDYTAPHTFMWFQGSSHTIAVTSPQNGAVGTRYVYASWSDGGAASHTVTTHSTTTYTANFTTQYLLTTSVSPVSSGSVSPDCSSGCWYNNGFALSLAPVPAGGYAFNYWSGDIIAYDAPLPLAMNGPRNITAGFSAVPVSDLVRIAGPSPVYFGTIGAAYAAAVSNTVIQIRAGSYNESLTTDRPEVSLVTFVGGYNATFADNTGSTIINAPLILQDNTAVISNLTVQ